jgi:hypothetical protein
VSVEDEAARLLNKASAGGIMGEWNNQISF